MGRAQGFSLTELVLVTAIALVITAALYGLLTPAQSIFVVQQEVSDMQQRMRAAYDTLYDDLAAAGSVPAGRQSEGSLAFALAPILPFRSGLRGADPPATFKTDVLTVVYAPPGATQTTLRQPMPAATDVVTLNSDAGCPVADPVCGFDEGMDVLILGSDGAFDVFTITAVAAPQLALRHNGEDSPKVYPAGSRMIEIVTRTYFLRGETTDRPPQLARYDGGVRPDVAVVDHVASLSFDYFADPAPPRMRRPWSDRRGPWTTYGPAPFEDAMAGPPGRAGSNCVFLANGGPLATPRLSALGAAGAALVRQPPAAFTDGPWCPTETAPNRFDADLLRIRSVGVSLRIESALAALRGPAGTLFARAGTATVATRYAPDIQVHFRVTPAALVPGR
jgi:prepilin-type N-terminal cleavage/methylation domain-containing protein